jgi:hypothetical protein
MSALRHTVDTFFSGSMTRTVAALLTGGEDLSASEIDELEAMIAKARKGEQS